ncbi:hypothetical protein [Actinoplanes sp. NBRC 101535]|uniref:hypothetical protein n=1 Tax=Actinoplanes sp. NBRC 101535 TaxID=3032196 RepID=UPI0024A5D62D|nr:hypothetical protein [Actinoplanes sp. NBRC 101535]GLY02430.1 hypothetical protein Acsp01_28090 [Actinoplanes sp. NBRC 101535]
MAVLAVLAPISLVAVMQSAAPAVTVGAADCLTPEGTAWVLDTEQKANAQLIIDVGAARSIPPRGWAVAIATAAQESALRAAPEPDGFGSSGLFQQTPPAWGTRAEVNDNRHATGSFYTALEKVGGWQTMDLTVAAQTVQISAFPDAYRKHTATAIDTVRDLGGQELDCSRVTLASGMAEPAPRNPDGSWPIETCAVRPDPTTGGGCLTPRTDHLVRVAAAAGYPKPGCWRVDNHGEHPKGRACDFMMTSGGEASGAQRAQGDAMAQWAVANADRLGLMYVIWFRRIWTPAQGWHAYNNPFGGNDPSGWHTNHVHISVY